MGLEDEHAAADRVAVLPEVSSFQYRWPVDFFRTWRYLLIPNDYVRRIGDEVLAWQKTPWSLQLQTR